MMMMMMTMVIIGALEPWKARHKESTESSHTGHCTRTSDVTDVLKFIMVNSVTCKVPYIVTTEYLQLYVP
jgi:hypothetical protein